MLDKLSDVENRNNTKIAIDNVQLNLILCTIKKINPCPRSA